MPRNSKSKQPLSNNLPLTVISDQDGPVINRLLRSNFVPNHSTGIVDSNVSLPPTPASSPSSHATLARCMVCSDCVKLEFHSWLQHIVSFQLCHVKRNSMISEINELFEMRVCELQQQQQPHPQRKRPPTRATPNIPTTPNNNDKMILSTIDHINSLIIHPSPYPPPHPDCVIGFHPVSSYNDHMCQIVRTYDSCMSMEALNYIHHTFTTLFRTSKPLSPPPPVLIPALSLSRTSSNQFHATECPAPTPPSLSTPTFSSQCPESPSPSASFSSLPLSTQPSHPSKPVFPEINTVAAPIESFPIVPALTYPLSSLHHDPEQQSVMTQHEILPQTSPPSTLLTSSSSSDRTSSLSPPVPSVSSTSTTPASHPSTPLLLSVCNVVDTAPIESVTIVPAPIYPQNPLHHDLEQQPKAIQQAIHAPSSVMPAPSLTLLPVSHTPPADIVPEADASMVESVTIVPAPIYPVNSLHHDQRQQLLSSNAQHPQPSPHPQSHLSRFPKSTPVPPLTKSYAQAASIPRFTIRIIAPIRPISAIPHLHSSSPAPTSKPSMTYSIRILTPLIPLTLRQQNKSQKPNPVIQSKSTSLLAPSNSQPSTNLPPPVPSLDPSLITAHLFILSLFSLSVTSLIMRTPPLQQLFCRPTTY